MSANTVGDVEVALCDWLSDIGDTFTVTPIDLQGLLVAKPALRIRRIGGGGDRDADHPVVSIQGYVLKSAANPRAVIGLLAQVERRFLAVLNGDNTGYAGGLLLENPDKTSGPVELPYPNTAIAVAESIYRLTIRR